MRAMPLVALVAVAAVVVLALPASAKEGVRAKLENVVRLDAPPGEVLRVRWRLVDADGHAFGASGIYLRVSRCKGRPQRVKARNLGGGRFSARVIVPKGGIRKLRVGLEGIRIVDGKSERSDIFFAFDPPLARRCG